MGKVTRTGEWVSKCRRRREPPEASVKRGAIASHGADLYWLAFLLTGCRELSIDIVADAVASDDQRNAFFVSRMRPWSRWIVITKAVAAIRDELAASARRTMLSREDQTSWPRWWPVGHEVTKARIEKALLAIDVFPRAAVLLLVFERVQLADAATLLDCDSSLIKKAQAIGLRELTVYLAGNRNLTEPAPAQPLEFTQATN